MTINFPKPEDIMNGNDFHEGKTGQERLEIHINSLIDTAPSLEDLLERLSKVAEENTITTEHGIADLDVRFFFKKTAAQVARIVAYINSLESESRSSLTLESIEKGIMQEDKMPDLNLVTIKHGLRQKIEALLAKSQSIKE